MILEQQCSKTELVNIGCCVIETATMLHEVLYGPKLCFAVFEV